MSQTHLVKASSFADPADVKAFKKYFDIFRGQGLSPDAATRRAFRYGDNAIGCWDDSTAEGSGASCALPPEDMIERWGSMSAAKHKKVLVARNGKSIVCLLKDTMPHRSHITNGAGIDLNPDAVRALGLEPPILTDVSWSWL